MVDVSTGGPTRVGLAVAILSIAAVTGGCVTSQVYQVGGLYYAYGPEIVVEALATMQVPPEDVCLAAMELAMANLELGRYDAVEGALAPCDGPPADLEPDRTYYGGEPHEIVWREVVRTSAALALQDGAAAAAAADRLVAEIESSACGDCRFGFARWIAALGYQEGWRWRDSVRTLANGYAADPLSDVLAAELVRAWQRSRDVPGFAPPPAGADDRRELVVVLLLGMGPEKAGTDQYDDGRFARTAPGYVRISGGTQAAIARVDDRPWVGAAQLTAVDELAMNALRARREVRGIETEFGSQWMLTTGGMDLRHWGSLPAVGAGLRLRVPTGAERVTLRYLDPFGFELGRETFDVPSGWRQGPLYVVRRVP
jgi:hypothetical protein